MPCRRSSRLPELQRIHETLIGKPLQKKSFRRRIEQAELLLNTGLETSGRWSASSPLQDARTLRTIHDFVRNLEE